MTEWISCFFDEKRNAWHARFRTKHGDTKRKIPAEFFIARRVDPLDQSPRAQQLAQRWAESEAVRLRDEKAKREAERHSTVAGIFADYKLANPDGVLPITMKNYEQRTKHLMEFFDTKEFIEPAQITRAHVAAYIRWREEHKPQPTMRTIRGEVSILRQLLDYAVEFQIVPSVRLISGRKKMPKIHAATPVRFALTAEQVKALLGAEIVGRKYDIDRAKRMIQAGVTTMLRRENLRSLRWEWIDAERRWLTIPAKLMKAKRELSVPVCEWAFEAFGEPRKEGFVFPSARGGRTKHLTATFNALADEANVPRFTLHTLRRTGYTWLGEHGVDKDVRKVLMGHRLPSLDEAYDQTFIRRLRAGVAVFDEIYGSMHPSGDA